jgi:hypothetical protein
MATAENGLEEFVVPNNVIIYIHTKFGEKQGARDAIFNLQSIAGQQLTKVEAIYYPGETCPEVFM